MISFTGQTGSYILDADKCAIVIDNSSGAKQFSRLISRLTVAIGRQIQLDCSVFWFLEADLSG